MNIFVLGNGFDLHHGLLTSYTNFLQIVEFIKTNGVSSYSNIGEIISNKKLLVTNSQYDTSYSKYSIAYDNTTISDEDLKILIEGATNNCWFNYLHGLIDNDKGWIDFEIEIKQVVGAFKELISKVTRPADKIDWNHLSKSTTHIIQKFNFVLENRTSESVLSSPFPYSVINPVFLSEKPLGSKNLFVDADKVAERLYNELEHFSEMLRVFLRCFVDNLLKNISKMNLLSVENSMFLDAHSVISFNYTSTYEQLYNKCHVIHHHGTINEKIILGIDSDQTDELSGLNTTFINFKKYYQRIIHRTDLEYIDFINRQFESINSYPRTEKKVFIVGHSLDKTDKEVITDVFSIAKEIYIYYHSENALKSLVKNLISIFGKEGFDSIRSEKKLRFELLT